MTDKVLPMQTVFHAPMPIQLERKLAGIRFTAKLIRPNSTTESILTP
jgi:hypothetical protein